MCCQCCSVRQQKVWVFSIGSLLAVLGVVLITAWPTIVLRIIRAKLPLTPSSNTFSKWETTPVPLYMTFYLYNWTNSHEVYNPNVKPHFEEHGPYAFREFKVKEDLEWHVDSSTVTYFARRTWYFDPDRSNGTLDDLIVAPNIPTMSTSHISRGLPNFMGKIINFGLNREGGAVTTAHTAIEWLFDGFYDDLFDFAERLHSPLLPIYDNRFAWYYERNASKEADGTYTIHTGKSDLTQMGDLKLWKGSNHTGHWEGECGKVNGSTGDLWTPGKDWKESLSIFIVDAERFINLFPQKKVDYHGIEGWLYTSTDQTFDSGYVVPDTKCFCVRGRECPKNGVIDYSPVAYGAPVYLSQPHFYMADPLYRANTTGLNPDPEKHQIFLLMEPTLGVPMDMNGQVLISLLVEPDERMETVVPECTAFYLPEPDTRPQCVRLSRHPPSTVYLARLNLVEVVTYKPGTAVHKGDLLRHIAHTFYAPLFVLQFKAEISDDILDFLKFTLSLPALGQYIGIGLTVLGVIMLIVGIWLTKTHNWRGDGKAAAVDAQDQQSAEKF